MSKQLAIFAESMQKEYTIDVDLLKVCQNQRIFYGQLVGLGFDTQVLSLRNVQKTLKEGNIKSGLFNYAASALTTFSRNDLQKKHVYILNLHSGKYAMRGTRTNAEFPIDSLQLTVNSTMIEVGTRPYYGKLFKVCPDVVCNDGYMDLYLFNFESKMAIARNIDISELGKYSLFVEIVPQAISFIVPKTFYTKFHPFDSGESQ